MASFAFLCPSVNSLLIWSMVFPVTIFVIKLPKHNIDFVSFILYDSLLGDIGQNLSSRKLVLLFFRFCDSIFSSIARRLTVFFLGRFFLFLVSTVRGRRDNTLSRFASVFFLSAISTFTVNENYFRIKWWSNNKSS